MPSFGTRKSKPRIFNVYIVYQRHTVTKQISDLLRVFSNREKAEEFIAGTKPAENGELNFEKWRVE